MSSENSKICPCCEQPHTTVERRRLNTQYVDEESNFLVSCQDCFNEAWEYYEERWADYYSGLL